MWAFVLERGPWPNFPVYVELEAVLRTFTVRRARWCWRVHLSAQDMSFFDVYWLALQFAFRELTSDVLDIALEVEDLEGVLAYRPWRRKQRASQYLNAISKNRIRPVPVDRTEDVERANRTYDVIEETPVVGVGGEHGLLFSQSLDLWVKIGREKIYVPVHDPTLYGALAGNHRTTPQLQKDDSGKWTLPDEGITLIG